MPLVRKHGELWPRNDKSLKALKEVADDPSGMYVLRDGSMPMYIGMGNIASRINSHCKSRSKGNCWDYFSWYAIPNKKARREIEALLLRLLPFYLRSLNKQRGRLLGSTRFRPRNSAGPDYVKRPHLAPRKRARRR